MSERPCCSCPLCHIETELLKEFVDTIAGKLPKILTSAAELAGFRYWTAARASAALPRHFFERRHPARLAPAKRVLATALRNAW